MYVDNMTVISVSFQCHIGVIDRNGGVNVSK